MCLSLIAPLRCGRVKVEGSSMSHVSMTAGTGKGKTLDFSVASQSLREVAYATAHISQSKCALYPCLTPTCGRVRRKGSRAKLVLLISFQPTANGSEG